MNRNNNKHTNELDFLEVIQILKKRYKLIGVLTLLALAASVAVNTFLLRPVYQTKAVLAVTQSAPSRPASGQVTGLEGLMNRLASVPQMTMNTYVNQLKSEAVMERVIKKLNLDRQGYTPSALAGLIGVTPVQETGLIDVKVMHSNPLTAQKIANTVTQEFLDFVTQSNEEQMGKSIEFLEKQAASAGSELDKALANMKNIEVNASGVSLMEQVLAFKNQDLLDAQSRLLQARAAHQGLLAGIAQARNQLRSIPPTIKVTSEATAANTAAGRTETSQPNPAYRDLKAKIEQKMIDAAQKGAEAASLQAKVGQVESEIKNMRLELVSKKEALDLARKEVARLEDTNSLIKTKINEAQVVKSLKLGETNLSILSAASLPAFPVRPNKTMNNAAAVTLGLMVSVALAILLNYMDNTLRTPQEVEDYLGLPVLVQVPVYKPYKGKPFSLPQTYGGNLQTALENQKQ